MNIEPSKTYLTSGDYVVVIAKGKDDSLLSTVETSPGVMYNGKNIHEINSCYVGNASTLGWYYDEDGTCTSPTDEWQGKLRIIEELPFSLPTLPTGYKWKGDFPQYRVPVIGEQFLGQTKVVGGARDLDGSVVKCCKYWLSVSEGEKRLIVELINTAQQIEPVASPQVESKTPEKPDLTESGKYKLLGSGDKFTKGVTECDSRGSFNKCDFSGNVSDYMRFNFRDPVVATPQKYRDIDPLIDTPEDHDEFLNESSGKWIVRNSVNAKKNASFDLTTKYRRPITSPVPDGMVEVTNLPDYIVKRNGDGYLTGKSFAYAYNLSSTKEYSVQWFLDISKTDYKLYATKENYNEWLASQEAQRKKVVDESRAKLMGNTVVKINGEEIKGAKVSHQMETIKVKLSEGETSTVREQIKKQVDQEFNWMGPEQLTVGYNNKPTLRQRALSYWIVDPIKTIAKEVKTALPYIVLGGSAWGITYSVFHIEEIKEYYNTHVPSISISVEAPEIISSKSFTK